jgi:hypothetical protein
MATNGQRKPPRPRIEMVTPAATPEEAAAVTAAIEQFLAETAPAPETGGPWMNPWQRAALTEGVRAKEAVVEHFSQSRSPTGRRHEWR